MKYLVFAIALFYLISCEKNKDIELMPKASFDFSLKDSIIIDSSNIFVGDTVVFENNSVNSINYFWDFGDGFYSNLKYPNHNYKESGLYKVRLQCSNINGVDSFARKIIISPKKQLKILFLGNSITIHGPGPTDAWFGNWGMAATSEQKDYVHVLVKKLEIKTKMDIKFKAQNIATWERNFSDTTNFRKLREFNANIIVVRLGENVDVNYAMGNNYRMFYNNMISYFITDSTKGIVVTNNFWPNNFKDSIQYLVSKNNKYTFADLSSLSSNTFNFAHNQYPHLGIAGHPSDFGMENIANILYSNIIISDWFKEIK